MPRGPRVIDDESRISREAKGRAAWYGAPQSYCVLHSDGSLQGNMRSNADDPASHAADLLGIIREVQAEHPEPEVCTHDPPDVRLRAETRRFDPAVTDGEIGLNAESRCRHVDADARARDQHGDLSRHRPRTIRRRASP